MLKSVSICATLIFAAAVFADSCRGKAWQDLVVAAAWADLAVLAWAGLAALAWADLVVLAPWPLPVMGE